jgi:ParB family transcriptional regulator, chromosome partitioning protein
VSDPSKPGVGLPPKKRMRHDRHFVDELAQRMGEGIGRMFRITAITANQDQPRSTLGDLSDLMASIQKHGVLEPLLVRRRADGLYQLVAGERRFHAAMQAGLSEVPCIEVAVSDEQALEIALVENLQRQDLSAFEEAEGFHTLVTKYNYTHEKVADAVGRSRVTVTETLRLLELPEAVREACRHADISAKGILLEVAKARTAPAMLRLIEEIEAHQLDRDAIRDRRRQLAHGTDDSDEPAPPPTARPRPYTVRFRSPDRVVSLSLSFRTIEQPKRAEVIRALETILDELRSGPETEIDA